MIVPIYKATCDCCGASEYLENLQNKNEATTELQARGWTITYQMRQMFCGEVCERIGA